MESTKRAPRLMAVATAVVVLLASPAGADIAIEFDELVSGPVGTVRTVAEAKVPPELVGDTCQISVVAENQASVHVGNDLIVSTGDSQAVFVGVEDEANGGTTETYEVTVGPTIVVQLRFGPDELSSLGFDLAFDCAPNPDLGLQTATSTTAPPNTVPPTTVPPSTTGPPTSAAQEASTTAPSTTVPPTTVPSTTGPPTSAAQEASTTAPPVIDERAAARDLPPAPVASAVVAAPAYAG